MTPRDPLDFPLVWPQFAHPWVLLLLAVPAALLAFVWAGRRADAGRRVVLPVDGADAPAGRAWRFALACAESLPPILLALAVCALAGPQRNGPPRDKRSLTNIQFAVDVSGSMTAPYGDGTRYDGAMKAIEAFLDYRKGDAFGLTFFGDAFVHWVPLTSDPSAIRCAPPFMRPEVAPPAFGGTAIGKALRGCLKELRQRESGDRMILLVTDGISYDIFGQEAELAKELADADVTVFCVIAAEFEAQAEVVTICHATGGEAFQAGDPEALVAVFKKIDAMKPAKVLPTFVEPIDYYEPFALAGLLVGGLGTLALLGLRYTPW